MNSDDPVSAWYDLSFRISSALAIIDSIPCYFPCGDRLKPVASAVDSIANLTSAAADILKLCKIDCETVERAVLNREP